MLLFRTAIPALCRDRGMLAAFRRYLPSVAMEPKLTLSGKMKKIKYFPPACYGGRHFVTMLPGHGIGPEMMDHIKDVFNAMMAPVDFEVIKTIETTAHIKEAITSILRNGCCIKANIEFEKILEADALMNSPNVAIRKKLDLYASVVVVKSYKNVKCKYDDLDMVVIRQNTEGEYSMAEHENVSGVVESMKVATRHNTERIANWAVRWAKLHNRKKITIVHKANIMKLSDGLFLQTTKKVLRQFPEIQTDDIIIDNCCMQMVSNPKQFDVLICPNLYGSILTNVLCGLIGGAGLISGSNYGDNYAAFETASRSTGTILAGRDVANPTGVLNSGVDLLYYLSLETHASALQEAIRKTIEDDGVRTIDIGGNATTSEMIAQIKSNLI